MLHDKNNATTIRKAGPRLTALVLTLALWLAVLPAGVFASGGQAPAAGASHIDAVLVLDVSNSMNTSDKDKVAGEAMKMFIDMLSVQGDKVGVVAYTDKVQREKALMAIRSPEDKQDLKQFIDGLDRGPYTDIAIGVEEAVKVLANGSEPGHQPMIVLLADGNNDFNKTTGRTEEQSAQELQAAVNTAAQNGYPIYTIGLNADGRLNKEALAKLSDQTGGKAFVTDTAEDLPQILSEIFASHLKLKVVPVQSITANGEFQEMTINVPNASVLEANISIISSQPVEVKLNDPSGTETAVPSGDVLLSRSSAYSLIKLLKPAEGDWKLAVKGVPQDKIDISLVFNYDLELKMEQPASGNASKGDKVEVAARLFNGGAQVTEAGLYNGMNAVLVVTDTDTGDVTEMPLDNSGDVFKGTFEVPDSHAYELKVRAEESSFYRESDTVTLNAKAGGGPAATAPPASGAPGDEEGGLSLGMILAIAGALLLAGAGTAAWMFWKKANRGFVGQMVIEIHDANTGERSHPQYKKLNGFRGKFNLHQLLQLAPELKESERLVFTPAGGDRLLAKGPADLTVERSGRAVDVSRGLELKSGDRISVPLTSVDKTVYLEFIV